MTRLKSEMFWRSDPAVEAARKHPAWARFHRTCAARGFYFDHIERRGRNGPYEALCYRIDHQRVAALATGTGDTPIAAVADAHGLSGHATTETMLALMELMG